MRAVWLDAGNNPNATLLKRYGVTRCYWPSHVDGGSGFVANPMLTATYIDSWRSAYEVGIYTAANWFTDGGAVTVAREIDAALTRLQQTRKQCAVHANLEKAMGYTPDMVRAFATEFRALRPLRELAWVVEGIQGGWLTPSLRIALSYYNVDVVAEAFTGSMSWLAPDEIRSNLVNYGIARQRALVMYDGDKLTERTYWDGCVFTQGRLR